jgi:hypothetical protein
MRNISFAHTTDQIRNRSKTVTRRLGWRTLRPGTLLRACVKIRGLKPGEALRPLAVIRVVSVRTEPLGAITAEDVVKEGYSGMTTEEFVAMFRETMKTTADAEVVRIEFAYE